MDRRLPIYLLIDSSGSMRGEPIQSVNVGIAAMLTALRQDPYALETVYLSFITFDNEVKELLPLQSLESAQVNDIELPRSGATHMGEGLNKVCDCVERDVITSTADQKGDFRPMLFVMTDGAPSDLMEFEAAVQRIKGMKFSEIIACAAGPKAKQDHLQKFATKMVSLETMDSSSFATYFQWVSASIAANASGQQNGVGEDITLPPPPDEVQVVL
ncbi:VWA domain-containing protein [Halomonas sp. 11-S5]|uniref:vWA domain-containing protein n=1 Tax=Halomonas sp. 11-S5 TaxID=2994064 RepID=UPI0024688C6B|nr:VWA domain-containing protein [Halomonas sp. 11-S5]